jgi:Tetracyclin repressor-like, C-terminal domain
MSAIFQRVVAEGIASGEFRSADPVVASRCVQVALIRFCHPTLIVQCAQEAGPSLEDMIEFVLAGLGSSAE